MLNSTSGDPHRLKQYATWFQNFREDNDKMELYFKTALDVLKKLNQIEKVALDKLKNKFFGNSGLSSELVDLYQSLHTSYMPELLQELQELLDLIKKENKELKKYFKSLQIENIMTLKELEKLCINYNENKRNLIQKIFHKIPGMRNLGAQIHGIHNQLTEVNSTYYNQSAQRFVSFYVEFVNQILEKANPSEIFVSLSICLNELEKYIRQSDTILEDFAQGLIEALNTINIGDRELILTKLKENENGRRIINNHLTCFLNNYFRAGASLGKRLSPEKNDFLKKLGWDNNTITKEYSVANEKNKADDWLKKTIMSLFKCQNLKFVMDGETDEENWVVERIKEVVKLPSNMKDLKKKFDDLVLKLSTLIAKEKKLRFAEGSKIDDLRIHLINVEYKKFNEMDEIFKIENSTNLTIAKDAVNKLRDIVNNKGNSFKNFINYQEDDRFDGSVGGGSGGTEDDDWFSEDDVLNKRDDLNNNIQELIGIFNKIDDHFDESRNWKDGHDDNVVLENIKESLQKIAATINSNESDGWSLVKVSIDDLKRYYDSINRLSRSFSRTNYKDAIAGLEEILNRIIPEE